MMRRMLRLLDPAHARQVRRAIGLLVAAAALQGLVIAATLPVLRGLFAGSVPWRWLAVQTAAVLAYAAVSYLAGQGARRVAYRMSYHLHTRIATHVARLPLGWFTAGQVGAFGRLTTRHVMDVMGTVGHLLEPLITAVVGPAVVLVVLTIVDWRLGLAALLVAPLLVAAYWWTGRLIARTDHATEAAAAQGAARLVEFAQQQPVLRAYGRTSALHGWTALDDTLLEQHRRARHTLRTAMPGLAGFALAIQAAFTLLLVVLATRVVGAGLDPAALVFLLVLVVRFVEPARTAAELGAVLRMSDGSLRRIQRLLDTPPLVEATAPRVPARPEDIELDRVSVRRGDIWALREVSLRIPAGSMTAIVGPSGAGKTTVLGLLARFYDPDAGQVRLGGVDLRQVSMPELMRRLGVVLHDGYLFEGTLAENLRFARPDATDAELSEVARVTRVDEIVDRLPGGWQARVGEGGTTLSGGERARVALARGLLADASIMLVDEGTSALDAVNEAAVVAALAELAGRRTVVVVAHRLETIRHADQIAVLDAGELVQLGTHAKLLTEPGRYADMWAHRARGGWRLTADRGDADRRQPSPAKSSSENPESVATAATVERS